VHAAAICYPERLKRFRAMPGAQEHNPATGQVGPFEEIAGYRLLRLLGYGGFAHTFLAEKGGARFALKLLNELPSGPAATRFEREVEALQLEHRNLVRYEDSGIASYGGLTRPYIAMPYVPGATLRDRIDGAPRSLPPDRLRAIGAEVADGLAFLHEHNVAHRDLTPKNVFLTEAGGVLIIDFGLARLQDRTSLTMKGQMLGTLAYCSPEQLRNETDLHTDLYGLGATLYHALTGQPPFEATSLPALVEMIRSEVPEPPSLRNPSVPDDLDDLVLALLAKEPVQRPTSALAVAESLRAPAGRRARPEPYDRDSPPLLAVRATTPSAARAILGAAMTGEVPDLALAAITAPRVLDELGRAASFDPRLHVAVDTKVETTAGLAMPKAVRSRPYAPEDGVPYRHEQLRDPDRAKRLARGDIAEQHGEGATVFRSPGFPFSGIHDPWIKRDVRLLSDALHARDVYDAEARLFATIRCDIDVLARREDRISIANRFARGTPSGSVGDRSRLRSLPAATGAGRPGDRRVAGTAGRARLERRHRRRRGQAGARRGSRRGYGANADARPAAAAIRVHLDLRLARPRRRGGSAEVRIAARVRLPVPVVPARRDAGLAGRRRRQSRPLMPARPAGRAGRAGGRRQGRTPAGQVRRSGEPAGRRPQSPAGEPALLSARRAQPRGDARPARRERRACADGRPAPPRRLVRRLGARRPGSGCRQAAGLRVRPL
jgi:hypothetical protein